MKKAFIFDMDGVIIDTEPVHAIIKQRVCRKYGIELPVEMFAQFVGRTSEDCFTEIAEKFNFTERTGAELAKEKHQAYLQALSDGSIEIPVVPGIHALLERIKKAGYIIGLASSSATPMINTALTRLGIKEYFSVIVSGADLPKSKPDPAVYLLAAEKLGIEPADCIVIEDAKAGIDAAKAAGMYCIAYHNPNSGNQDLSRADKIVNSHDDIEV